MYLNKNEILQSLTKEDVIKIVVGLGSKYPKTDNQGNLIFQTVCHGSDSWKLYYYHEPDSRNGYKGRTFHCYTKCSDSFNIVELVIRANRVKGKTVTWYKALKHIVEVSGKVICNDKQEGKSELITDFEWINRFKRLKNKEVVDNLVPINENILDIFYYAPHEEWLKDGISREALSRYEIGYYGLTNQIIIPHRDIDSRLIGIRGRYLDDEDVERLGKYLPLFIGGRFLAHSLGSNLYGIDVVKDKIIKDKKIMLVESEKGCMQNYSFFGEDSFAVATCGSSITTTQQKFILQNLKCEEVYIAFDREYKDPYSFEAEIYYDKLIKKVANLVPYCKVYFILDDKDRLNYKDSPTDKGKDLLLDLLKEKILITREEVLRVLAKKS